MYSVFMQFKVACMYQQIYAIDQIKISVFSDIDQWSTF